MDRTGRETHAVVMHSSIPVQPTIPLPLHPPLHSGIPVQHTSSSSSSPLFYLLRQAFTRRDVILTTQGFSCTGLCSPFTGAGLCSPVNRCRFGGETPTSQPPFGDSSRSSYSVLTRTKKKVCRFSSRNHSLSMHFVCNSSTD